MIDSAQTRVTVPFADLARDHAPLAGELTAAFGRLLRTSGFILGEEVEGFETEFAAYSRTDFCVGVASGTAALQIMLEAAGIGGGDEVIVPAHTFIATALAVMHAGATPVPVDVERDSGLIDPEAVRAAIGPRTAAIMAVHLYGQTCKIGPLRELTNNHGLLLLEDAAQAHGATYRGERAGGLGHAAAFSFYPSKNLGALGDAGAICTNDARLAEAAKRLRDLGRGDDGQHFVAGYNERLDGIQAALLRVKLPHLEEWNRRRRKLAAEYRAQLEGRVDLLGEAPESPCTYHLFPIRVSQRDRISSLLAQRGVATGVHYPRALPEQPPLACYSPDTPVAIDWARRELSLPIFPSMNAGELDAVLVALEEVLV